MKKNRVSLFLSILAVFISSYVFSDTLPVRIKDIGNVVEARDNQLNGFGLVTGLRHTGDSNNSAFTNKALTNLLNRMGITPNDREYRARNVAAVIVTADLPPFIKKGQRIDVVVSALGDATSLVGGTLVLTQLKGPDNKTYALAQGSVIVGGISGEASRAKVLKNRTTVGRIPNGAIVEVEVPVTWVDQRNITLVLDKPNFLTAVRTAKAIAAAGFEGAQAMDANMIKVPVSDNMNFIEAIARIENLQVVPDGSNKVIINSRTGTVVIGELVRLSPVAVTHGNISVKISEDLSEQQGLNLGANNEEVSPVKILEPNKKIVKLSPQATLSSLVSALNEIKATPQDLISIIQALKQSGALVGEIEIL